MGLNSSPLQNVDPRPPAPPPRSTKRKRRVDFTKLIQVNEDYDEEREWYQDLSLNPIGDYADAMSGPLFKQRTAR